MANIARKSDGRRIFTDEFKRRQIDRVSRGDLTIAELSRKTGIARSLLHRWKHSVAHGTILAGAVRERVTPAGKLQGEQYIRELQLLVGKQSLELELLRAELDVLRRARRSRVTLRR
jgi:transposase-like protein